MSADAAHPFYHLMLEAIALSRNGFGRTAPNPCVGALLVREGRALAGGWHAAIGGDHAERALLAKAKEQGLDPASCTLVVSLEPCAHHGRTPPCVDAVLEAGIRHVVIGAPDRHPLAAGGAERLAAAGVKVESGVALQECLDNIADFLLFQRSARPYVILKLASSLDGRIACRNGVSAGLSDPEALAHVHWLRSRTQAVLIGGNTLYADNPRLNARLLPTEEKPGTQPWAVVLSSRLPDASAPLCLLRERPERTIFLTGLAEARSRAAEELRRLGAAVRGLEKDAAGSGLNIKEGLEFLRREYNCFYVLCEGGGRLGLSLLQQGLADELLLHLSPRVLGDGQAVPLFDGLAPKSPAEARNLRLASSCLRGRDLCLRLFPETPAAGL